MVTLPDEAATDIGLIKKLLQAGMSVARINCAQKDAKTWKQLIANIRQASRLTGRSCRILMDLSGPKLRTGTMVEGPRVMRIRPERDPLGRLLKPAVVWLGQPAASSRTVPWRILPVPEEWARRLRKGDRITFRDVRGKKRELIVCNAAHGRRIAECSASAVVQTGTVLRHKTRKGVKYSTRVGDLLPRATKIVLKPGDILRIHKERTPGEPALVDAHGQCTLPAHISCTLPEVFRVVRRGEPVAFDNGIAEGIIERVLPGEFHVRIVKAAGGRAVLKADKGINLPRTNLRTKGLTARDLEDLRFSVENADLVSLSFVRTADDVRAVLGRIRDLRSKHPGIVVKIETRDAVSHLPEILRATADHHPSGIMMARGDLAVEYGWEKLPALQFSLMAQCEAAELPFMVATQILETMTQKGTRSRAEILDAAVAGRAQGVLLNKGAHLVDAVQLLKRILRECRLPRSNSEF
jgi:pyruvate kinase